MGLLTVGSGRSQGGGVRTRELGLLEAAASVRSGWRVCGHGWGRVGVSILVHRCPGPGVVCGVEGEWKAAHAANTKERRPRGQQIGIVEKRTLLIAIEGSRYIYCTENEHDVVIARVQRGCFRGSASQFGDIFPRTQDILCHSSGVYQGSSCTCSHSTVLSGRPSHAPPHICRSWGHRIHNHDAHAQGVGI